MFDWRKSTPTKLEWVDLALDESEVFMAVAIMASTEATREYLRGSPLFGMKLPPRGLPRRGKPEPQLVDQLPWPSLLIIEGCADNAAKMCGCIKKDIYDFAWRLCGIDQWMVLAAQKMTEDAFSPEFISGLKAVLDKQRRIKEGARRGGEKGGAKRETASLLPSREKLLLERDGLIRAGTPSSGAAGVLAKRHGVTPDRVRAVLTNRKRKPKPAT